MPAVIKPKKSETASSVPSTSDLVVGEICMNVADKKIYTRKSDNSIVVVSSHIDASSTAVGGDLTGTVSNAQIGSNTVTATELADNSVGIAELNVADGTNLQVLTTNGSGTLSWTSKTDATLGANSVGITELNVSDGDSGQYLTTNGSGTLSFATDSTNVGATSVGGAVTGTVSNIQIAADAITGAKIADNAINSEHYTDGSIDTAHIGDNQVTGAKIALGSDAAGDIMYYNGTNYIRLAKGSAAQLLTINSGATAPEWTTSSGATIQQVTAKAVTMAIALG